MLQHWHTFCLCFLTFPLPLHLSGSFFLFKAFKWQKSCMSSVEHSHSYPKPFHTISSLRKQSIKSYTEKKNYHNIYSKTSSKIYSVVYVLRFPGPTALLDIICSKKIGVNIRIFLWISNVCPVMLCHNMLFKLCREYLILCAKICNSVLAFSA